MDPLLQPLLEMGSTGVLVAVVLTGFKYMESKRTDMTQLAENRTFSHACDTPIYTEIIFGLFAARANIYTETNIFFAYDTPIYTRKSNYFCLRHTNIYTETKLFFVCCCNKVPIYIMK